MRGKCSIQPNLLRHHAVKDTISHDTTLILIGGKGVLDKRFGVVAVP
jgi:hypothetical protein